MPLVVMCGFPGSGKSTRALELMDYLENKLEKTMPVVLISEDTLLIDRNKGYADSTQEKNTRSALKAQVEKEITSKKIVILDSLNYIKGFRYELYCLSRNQGTTHCVILTDVSKEIAKEFNAKPLNISNASTSNSSSCSTSNSSSTLKILHSKYPRRNRFDEKLFDEICYRFERPQERNRWDKPLFKVTPMEPLLVEEIGDWLINSAKPKPHMSVQKDVLHKTNYLFDLDKLTQQIVGAIIKQLKQAMPGEKISVAPHAKRMVTIKATWNAAALRRKRREFLKMSKYDPPKPNEAADSFVSFLNSSN